MDQNAIQDLPADRDALVWSASLNADLSEVQAEDIDTINENIAGPGSESTTTLEAGSVLVRSIVTVPGGQGETIAASFTQERLEKDTGFVMEGDGMTIVIMSGADMQSDSGSGGGGGGGSGGSGSGDNTPTVTGSNNVVDESGVSTVIVGVSVGVSVLILCILAFACRRYMLMQRARADGGEPKAARRPSRPSASVEGGSHDSRRPRGPSGEDRRSRDSRDSRPSRNSRDSRRSSEPGRVRLDDVRMTEDPQQRSKSSSPPAMARWFQQMRPGNRKSSLPY